MTHADYFMMALCLWREARGEGRDGQIAVGCVIKNRVNKHMSSVYTEVVKPWQFSSITATGDPQLGKYPVLLDTGWGRIQELARALCDGEIQDTTGGATLYYADSIPFPSTWDKSKLTETVKIGHHTFFVEHP